MKKRSVRLLLGLVLCLSLMTNVLESKAADQVGLIHTDATFLGLEDGGAVPRYEPHCGRYATHDMLANGWATVFYHEGGTAFSLGCQHQCTRCFLVIATQNEPVSSSIGYWTTYQAGEKLNTMVYIWAYRKDVYYTTDKTISGITFRF